MRLLVTRTKRINNDYSRLETQTNTIQHATQQKESRTIILLLETKTTTTQHATQQTNITDKNNIT